MSELLRSIASAIAASPVHDAAVYLLRNVPGFPPILQTVHLLSIATVLGSIVLLSLRVIGVAVPLQSPQEMSRRLAPWTWTALGLLLLSGSVLVLARPGRYFTNPVFGAKFALLLPALVLSIWLYRAASRSSVAGLPMRVAAVLAIVAWVGVILAGRWIAYVDYLLPVPE